MYSLADYVWMIADGARVAAYAGAVRALVRPGDRVLEIGAGFGFFSVIAARAGAAHVDAVETNPAVHLGPRIAAANGCADRIAFHHLDVRRLALDAPADVLLIDARGPTPFGRRTLELIVDARTRLLRPGGTVIAECDTIFAAPARTPAVFAREVQQAHGREGVALDPVERVLYDTPMRCVVAPDDLLAEGVAWTTLDYRTIDRIDHSGGAAWIVDRDVRVDGLAVWFEADLGGGFTLSSAPGSAVVAYRQMFVPFRTPIDVPRGHRVAVTLSARALGDSYVWSWRTTLDRPGAPGERTVVDQNSLAELVIDPAALPRTSPDVRPLAGARGRALQRLLSLMDGRHTLAALAGTLRDEMPALFPDAASAETFAAEWARGADRLERGVD